MSNFEYIKKGNTTYIVKDNIIIGVIGNCEHNIVCDITEAKSGDDIILNFTLITSVN